MATTVSYKNNALTTIGYNDSATLTTQGTWLEDDITIDVDALNLQTKTVTPSENQQIITPDPGYTTWKSNVNDSVTNTGPAASLSYKLITGNDIAVVPSTGYIKINGIMYVFLNDGTQYKTQFIFEDCIIDISSSTTIASGYYGTPLVSGITIAEIGSQSFFDTSNFKTLSLSRFTGSGSNKYISIAAAFDAQYEAETLHIEVVNFTVNYSTSNSFIVGYDGLSQVTVNAIPSNYVVPTGTKTITQNGTGIDVASYATVDVAVDGSSSINLQSKTNINPTTSSQTITADSEYDGLSSVQINAMPSGSATAPASISGSSASITTGSNTITLSKTVSVTPSVSAGYVSSGTAGNSSVSLTASVTVNPTPTASGATVTIPAGYYSSQTTKSVSTTTHPNPTVSVNSSTGLITASHTQTAGYVTAGTTTGTSQLSVQAATTITPTTSSQTAVAAGKYTTGAVTVAAIPANYVDSSSLKTYYTGSSAPSSSLGSNGDLYFQTTEE